MSDREDLAALVRELAVVHGKVTLSSGKEADYYVDLRRATLHHKAAPLIGSLLRELVADWDFDAVGGLTMGADPVAMAVMHAPGRPIDAFVVRKAAKAHGMQRQIEGPDIVGKRVLVVEDDPRLGPIMRDVMGSQWDVSLAPDIARARALLTDQLFDAAVVDRRTILPDLRRQRVRRRKQPPDDACALLQHGVSILPRHGGNAASRSSKQLRHELQ